MNKQGKRQVYNRSALQKQSQFPRNYNKNHKIINKKESSDEQSSNNNVIDLNKEQVIEEKLDEKKEEEEEKKKPSKKMKERDMEEEYKYGQMEVDMKVIGNKIKQMYVEN